MMDTTRDALVSLPGGTCEKDHALQGAPDDAPANSLADALAGALEAYGHLPQGVVLGDEDDRVLFANPAFHTITEVTPRDLEFMNFQDVLSLFCLVICTRLQDVCCPANKWLNVERAILRADGNAGWVRIHLSLVEIQGRLVRQLLVEDVTRYRECIDGLLHRKKRYQTIVEKRPDPICCFLPDWSLTYANTSCCRCLGQSRRNLAGEHLLLLLPPPMREIFARAVARISPEQPVAEVEQRLDQFGDQPLWVRWVIQGFFYKTGHIKDYQAVGVDITPQKMAESKVLHADRLVSLGALVSEVAHEINNPNNFIMLNAPLVLDLWWRLQPVLERLAEEQEQRDATEGVAGGFTLPEVVDYVPQLLQGVVEGSRRIDRIVKDLKVYAARDGQPGQPSLGGIAGAEGDDGFELLGLNEVVETAVRLMRKAVGRKTRRFSVRLGTGLPPVRGRRQRLEQIVINLLQNACHALEHPDQAIEVATSHDEESGSARITVRDEGVGIPVAELPLVTQPFYSTRGGQGGAGLGLSISLSIAREHGGRLWLESGPEGGASAVVELPVAIL